MFGVAAVALIAAACTFQNTRLTNIGGTDTYAGEVVNDTGANFLGTTVDVAFLDSSNNVVDTQQVVPALRSWQAGSMNFFSASSSSSASTATSVIARLGTDSTLVAGTTVPGNITLSNVATQRDPNGTTLHVTGTIQNLDYTVLAQPHVAAVVRDTSGNVVVVAMDTGIVDLGQNQSATFSIDVAVPDSTSTVSTVDIWADGLENGVPTNPASFIGVSVVVGTPSNFQNQRLTNIGGQDTYAGQYDNNTGVNYLNTNVNVAFQDVSGNVIDTQQAQPALRSLQTGRVNFFAATSSVSPTQITNATATLATGSLVIGNTIPGNIALSNVAAQLDPTGTMLNVTGTIQNLDYTVLAQPRVVAVMRDGSGNIVTVNADAGIADLNQNQSATFSISIGVPASTVSTVDVWADGLENGIPTNPASVSGTSVIAGTPTATPTATATGTATPAASVTPTDTPTPATTVTPTSSATATTVPPTSTATATPSGTATATATATPTP